MTLLVNGRQFTHINPLHETYVIVHLPAGAVATPQRERISSLIFNLGGGGLPPSP